MGRARVHKSQNRDDRVGNEQRNEVDTEGLRVRKSRCVESELHICTVEFNAVLSLCRDLRTALYFSKLLELEEKASLLLSEAVATWALALVAEVAALLQSLAMCPEPPQNMQRLFLKQCWHS